MVEADQKRESEAAAKAAGAPDQCGEWEITPEMIRAGFAVLCKSGIVDDYLEADKLLVGKIFEAMFREYRRQAPLLSKPVSKD
jgi:hypothetical protein